MGLRNIRPIVLVVLLVGGFCLPLLAGWEKLFYDDIACFFYPQQAFVSRSLQQGTIPWWDPHTFCGAKPYYAGFYQCSLYPLQWPFLLAAPSGAGGLYLWTVKIPLALHFLMAALGGYLLGRIAFGFSRWGATVFTSAYSFSPTMTYMAATPTDLFTQSWLPLIGLGWLGYARSGKPVWLVAGSCFFALASPSGDMPFIVQNLINLGLIAAGWTVVAVRGRRWSIVKRLLGGGICIFVTGGLLSAVYWLNMADGFALLSQGPEMISGFTGIDQSLPPAYLATILFPDLFGGLTSLHSWGAAYGISCSLNDANLSGGLAVAFLALLSFRVLRSNRAVSIARKFPSPQAHLAVFGGMFVLSLLIVLGRYTPAYGLLARVPIFGMPYPVRYRFIQCLALAGLLGTSVSFFDEIFRSGIRRLTAGYLLAASGVFGLALMLSYARWTGVAGPGFRHLTSLDDWSWFVTSPFLSALAVGTILGIGSRLRPRNFGRLVVVLVLVEIFSFGYLAFYRNCILNFRNRDLSGQRYSGPSTHPFYREIARWSRSQAWDGELYRRGCYRSILSNISWFDGSLSALGFDSKPLIPRYEAVVASLVEGFPYELRIKDEKSRFWPNQSVKELLLPPPPGGEETLRSWSPEGVLPRVYFQNRWRPASAGDQACALRENDLRLLGFREEEGGVPRSWVSEPGSVEDFNRLQEIDRLLAHDFSSPNRIWLETECAVPAMLVITDVWHPAWRAFLDGKETPVRRVNYCQRGIAMETGDHTVEFVFRPPRADLGLVLGAVGLAGLFLISFYAYKKRAGRGRHQV